MHLIVRQRIDDASNRYARSYDAQQQAAVRHLQYGILINSSLLASYNTTQDH